MVDVMVCDNALLRGELIACARNMNRYGINVNKSGNVSVRVNLSDGEPGFLITPSGVPYEELLIDDIVFVPFEDPPSLDRARGVRRASSEWEMHERIYRQRKDVGAIVHTHSCYATALACQGIKIPAFHYMVAVSGGDSIDVAPYRTFGSSELADVAAKALLEKNACLLEHHGVLAVSVNLTRALTLAVEVENLAHQYCIVRMLGEPALIEPCEMQRVIEKFRVYGQPQLACSKKKV